MILNNSVISVVGFVERKGGKNRATGEKLETAETAELWQAEDQLLGEVEQDQLFSTQDIRDMHHLWLGDIYTWAGDYRQVNISKDGFNFAMVRPSQH